MTSRERFVRTLTGTEDGGLTPPLALTGSGRPSLEREGGESNEGPVAGKAQGHWGSGQTEGSTEVPVDDQ